MSKDLHNTGAGGHGVNGHGDYEREDFSTATIVGSLIGLAVMCIVSFFIVVGMYKYLKKTQMEHVAANPMVPMIPDTLHPEPMSEKPGADPLDVKELQGFAKPRLQRDDVQEMREQLYGEEGQLQSYGWVDQDSGEARIPIARAMELTVERGLPVRTETPATPAPGAKTPAKPAQNAAQNTSQNAAKKAAK